MWVYFCLIDDGQIKIGSTRRPLCQRMNHFRKTTISTHKVSLLAAVKGTANEERQVQRYFDADAIDALRSNNNVKQSENFYPTVRLTNYIRWLRNQWFVVIDENSDEETEHVSSNMWLPTVDRQTDPPRDSPLFGTDHLDFSSREITADDYYTPKEVIECAHKFLGSIDLDPASHVMANRRVKARHIFTLHDNGLKQPWKGKVWCNPPFSKYREWVPKILQEASSLRVTEICFFASMHASTAVYFHDALKESSALCIIRGRLSHAGIGEGKSPDRGHGVLYIGDRQKEFVNVFHSIGVVWTNAMRKTTDA